MNKRLQWMWDVWRPHKAWVLVLFVLTAFSTAVAVAYPLVFRRLVDLLSNVLKIPEQYPTPMVQVNRIILVLLGIGVLRVIASVYPGVRAMLNLIFEYFLRRKYFGFILEKDWRFFQQFRTGDLVTRLTIDIADYPKIGWFLCSGIFRAFDSLIKVIFCIGVMFFMNSKLTLLSLIPVPLTIAIFYITSGRLQRTFKQNQEAIGEINNQLELSFSGIRIIKSFVCEKQYNRFFKSALNTRFDTEMRLLQVGTVLRLLFESVGSVAQVGVIGFGGYMVVKGEITVGTFLAFYSYLSMLIYPILDLPQLFVAGKQAFVNIDRLDEIRDFPVSPYQGTQKISRIETVGFQNVDFGYPGRMLFRNLSFTVPRGRKVVVMGPVGSGKSTLLGMLTGRVQPSAGEILVNGIPMSKIDIRSLRDILGCVPQEPSLFSGTLKENVEFGAVTPPDDSQYQEALTASQMASEIDSFAAGDQTLVGQRGLMLSGGQKQRLAIARAIIRSPQLLLLDDITASLDAENEEKLWLELDRIFSGLTCFIVSHRLSTLRYVDDVLFIDGWHVLGPAPHEELLNYPRYRAFVEEQGTRPVCPE